jgi:hypothetical protein
LLLVATDFVVSVPIVITKDYLLSALDNFPRLETIDWQKHYFQTLKQADSAAAKETYLWRSPARLLSACAWNPSRTKEHSRDQHVQKANFWDELEEVMFVHQDYCTPDATPKCWFH